MKVGRNEYYLTAEDAVGIGYNLVGHEMCLGGTRTIFNAESISVRLVTLQREL